MPPCEFTVAIPTLNEAGHVAGAVRAAHLAGAARVLVIDGGSTDGTQDEADDAGAEVIPAEGLPPYGTPLGKGDSLWRTLPLVDTDYTVFLDGDIRIEDRFVTSLLQPLVEDGKLFSKAAFERRTIGQAKQRPGRVTELVARPLLSTHFPQLAHLQEPLSGQIAAPTSLLRRLSFECDYGLEAGMLIDVYNTFGMSAIAHPDCGTLAHAPNEAVVIDDMAAQVERAITVRSGAGPHDAPAGPLPRPPHLP